jgi:HEAT repeat protein
MLDSKQIKVLGLRFARALQTTVKTAGVFTIEHKSCDRPIQQSFLLLNNMLKEVGQFTVGFVDNQILLNNLLTTDTSLKNLETEFLKRGIAAITFEPGLTLSRYKKVIHVLAASTAAIDATGGFLAFLDQNEVEGVRIIPAAKNQKKNEAGDTILETDSEAYILSKQVEEDRGPRDFLDSIDALMESGCFDPSARSEVLSNFAAQGVDGAGYGVPIEVPQMVLLKEGEAIGPAQGQMILPGEHGGGGRSFSAAAGNGPGGSSTGVSGGYPGAGIGMPGMGGVGIAGGSAIPGSGSGGYAGSSALPGMESASTWGGGMPAGLRGMVPNSGSGSFIELVEASVQRSLLEERGNPEKSYASLARILRNTGVDKILEKFSPERRQDVSTLPPEQLAAEYFQDTALQLAGKRIQSATGETQKIQLEEEVVYLLARSLQATHMADRLSQKLTKFIQDYAVPPHIQEKIREELNWTSLVTNKKYARLMELKHYSNIEFRRLLEVMKDFVAQRDMDRATALASHYFEFLDEPGVQIENSELSRAPELIRAISVAHAGFAGKTAERLGRTLMREDLPEFIHFQAASTATILAQAIASFEDFHDVLAIGLSLEASANRLPEKHKKCCAAGLSRLLPDTAIERVTELYLQQRGDSTWSKTAATLLRYSAPASVETVFRHLISEEDGRNRLALVRLVSQLGKSGIEVACKYLEDERWYVVRNMCGVLAELKDPDLVEHVAPALRHADARVQQAALKALVKTRAPETASVLAAALPKLAPNVLDEAIDELMFLKNASASAITDLEEFVGSAKSSPASKRKALQALGSIQDDGALYALARLFRMEELEAGMRKASLLALTNHRSAFADTLLKELAANWGPLAEEAKAALVKRKPR